MSQVNVTINGRQFRMACEDGEEARLSRLAEELDASIATLRTRFGEIGDTRLTVMAALTLADQLSETKSWRRCGMRAWPRPIIARRRRPRLSPRSMRRPSASRTSPSA